MSIFDRAKTVGLFEGAAGADRKLFNIKPEEKLTGDEIAVDGTFDDASGWTKSDSNTNWSITGGKAVCDGQQSAGVSIYRNMGVQTDKVVRVSFELSDVTAGTVGVVFYATTDTVKYVGTNGKHVFYHTIGSGGQAHNGNIGFAASSSFVGKVDNLSIVEVSQKSSDFKFDRGSNITATRINKDGLIEKGRENLCYNTVFAGAGTDTDPTGWGSSNQDGGGTFAPLASDSEKIKVEITDASNAADRWFLVFSQSGAGVYTTSIYVDEVTGTAPAINQVMTSIASTGTKTEITYFKDGEKVAKTDAVEAGHRYSYAAYHSGNSVHRWGLGTSSDITSTCSVTISQPQIEKGIAPTEYIKNTSTVVPAKAGILEDEPRFDYTGGGCPKLLMEMGSANKQTHSEYLASWDTLNLSLTTNAAKSPEGVKNASKIVESTDTGLHRLNKQWTFVDGTIYSLSFFAKAAGRNKIQIKYGTDTVANFDATFTLDGTDPVNNGDGTASMQSMGDGWYRCKIENIEGHRLDTGDSHPESLSTAFNILLHNDANPTQNSYEGDGSSGVLIYGFQQEEKPFATSYIPSYGTEGSRSMDNNIDDAIPAHSYDLNKSWSLFVDFGETKGDLSSGSQPFIDLETDSGTKKVALYVNDNDVNSGLNLYLGTANNGYVFSSNPNDAIDADSSSVCASYDHTNYRLTYYINGDLYGYQATELSMGDSDSGGGKFRVNTGFLVNVKKYLFFEEALSDTEAAILTGTSYNSFGAMVDALTNYTTYE